MVNSRVVLAVLVALAGCDKGSAKSGPTCDQAAANIVTVRTKGEKSVHTMEAKGTIAKLCTDAKWTDDARTCISKATTADELKTCVHDKLTGDQADKLKTATASLGGSDIDAVMAKMREFKDKMCACKDAKCAQAVSDDMTKWGQEQAKEEKEPPKLSDEQVKEATDIGEQMGNCMVKAMGGDMPTTVEQPEPKGDSSVLLK